ncbi:ABC-type transport auxiliary lipoprotein family protein [Pontixanthobacter aestiaquae]|uniref:ABC transporter n=2 Tax=Pontixanthobacter aestiaquae TaxID=1509367 RepID=A0A844Z7V3_9SPHN|nr:ABC-type transport auxiliary lipoprotein family protein [Pontixanthobacter aestiaquae]MDN3646108.1 ABC-type transport auxiliary lipoprotein family protein [Pontixanthobacter aestiaquae]MXO82900.1 ABC transporter [Pontixanthobacter aestiaquae]
MDKETKPMNILRGSLAFGLAIALSGCISLGSEPPPSLLTLTPDTSVPAGAGASGTAETAIKIMEPEAPQRLAVSRVPVQVTDTEIAYLKDAIWVERPTRLFRRLLAETIRARGERLVIDGDDPGIVASAQLRGILRNFGYDARTSSVIVRFDAIRAGADGGIETKRFESVQSGVLAEASEVGDALNRGANDVAGQVAEWIGS